jgi:membrane associated rhomboid family serine protease
VTAGYYDATGVVRLSDIQGLGALSILVVTLVASLLALYAAPALLTRAVFRPYWLVRNGEYARLITSGFVHANLAHLIFNLITYYFFAFQLERRIGTGRFLALYFAGLLFSNVGTYIKHRNEPNFGALGASGAILALLFASIVYFPTQSMYILPLPLPIPAPLFAIGYLAYSYYLSWHSQGRINHDAHFDGALTGLVFVAVTEPSAYQGLLAVVHGWRS